MTAQSTLPLLLALSAASCAPTTSKEPPRPERRFHFEYKTTLSGFPADAKLARVWIPLPADDEAQAVTNVKVDSPVPHRVTSESVYGDRAVYLEVVPPFPSELPVTLSMDVHRSEISSVKHVAGSPRRERLLEGDRLAPLSTEAHSRANQATQGLSDSNAQAHRIYERVLADVNYDKSGVGWGRGDLEYVCAAGKGNCSDFHSLFIAMARSKSIPAVFEIGFPILVDKKEGTVSGYHCWAWYQDSAGAWRPVDASEADKDPKRADYFFGTICQNRVAFSRGRDVVLEPPQKGDPLNFFIYPYVEVDGKTEVAKAVNGFRFADL